MKIKGIDYIELYVGNAKLFAYYLSKAFGFSMTAYGGLETGLRDRTSYVVESSDCRFVVTSGLHPESPITRHVLQHGDSVKDVAFTVDQAEQTYLTALKRGGIPCEEVKVISDGYGFIKKGVIGTYGNVVHSLVERQDYKGAFLPGYQAITSPLPISQPALFKCFDHVVANVEYGNMDKWIGYYHQIFGFNLVQHFSDDDIRTKHSGLMSKVLENSNKKIKLLVNEPSKEDGKCQIQEYLDYHQGPGVQHVAVETEDIIHSVSTIKERGVELLTAPDAYYETLSDRVGKIEEDYNKIKDLNILVDRDDDGYLLQIFTQTVPARPTLFFEIIQRKGSLGFGKGNILALFEAVEKGQARRGNL